MDDIKDTQISATPVSVDPTISDRVPANLKTNFPASRLFSITSTGQRYPFLAKLPLSMLVSLIVLMVAYRVQLFSQVVDIGKDGDATFVSRFYAPEQNGTFDYRWTRDESDVTFSQAGAPYQVIFQAATPETDQTVEVSVSVNGEEIGRVQVDHTVRAYTLKTSKISWGPEDLTLTFRPAHTFQESTKGGRGALGILLDWVKVAPYSGWLGIVIPPPFQLLWWILLVHWPLLLFAVLRLPVRGRKAFLLPLANLITIAGLFCLPPTTAYMHTDWALLGLVIGLVELAGGVTWAGFKGWQAKRLFHRAIPKACLLFLLLALACFYLATTRGRLSYSDDQIMEAVSAAIVSGNPATPLTRFISFDYAPTYATFGIGLSIVGVPFYALGNWLTGLFPAMLSEENGSAGLSVFVLLFTDLCLTVGTVFLFYRFQRLMKIGPRAALLTAALFAIATMAWHYSRTFLSEPLVALCILAALVSGLYYRQTGKWGWAGLSGFMLGLAFVTRISNLALVPLFGLFMLWNWWERKSMQEDSAKINSLKSLVNFSSLKSLWGPALAWVIGIAFWAGIFCWYNLARYGSISSTGYKSEEFSTPLLTGIYGLLFSPGKSIFLYNPVLLLGLAGFPVAFKKHRPVVILVLAILAAFLGVYALWKEWYGGGVWGPRPLVPVIPLLLWPAGYIFGFLDRPARLFKWSFKPWLIGGVIALIIGASLLVQFLSVVIDYQIYMVQYGPNYNRTLFDLAINNPAYSPILEHWRLWTTGTAPDLAYNFYHETPFAQLTEFVFQAGLLLSMGFSLLAIGLYWRSPRPTVTTESTGPELSPVGANAGL